jgi:hypothetical protein
MHPRPRVSTCSVIEKPCRYRYRHIGAFCQLPIKAASSASSCCWMRAAIRHLRFTPFDQSIDQAATSTRATTTAFLRFQLLHNSGNLPHRALGCLLLAVLPSQVINLINNSSFQLGVPLGPAQILNFKNRILVVHKNWPIFDDVV